MKQLNVTIFKYVPLLKMAKLLLPFLSIVTATKTTSTCNILALSGGGAFGATEIGILDSRVTDNYLPDKYDVITGISAGGLNAAFLSYYSTITEALPAMRDIFSTLNTQSVYNFSIWDILSEYSLYDNSPLENTLTNILSSQVLQQNGPTTIIGASNVNTEKLDIFHFNQMNLADRVDTLMATSAIPLVFPPRKINGSLYVDGGVISNELINQALGEISCSWYNVTFISASNHLNSTVVVDGFFSYVGSVFKLIYRTFDYQLAQLNTNCVYPRGQIVACFPTSPLLDNYSMLDFDDGLTLYNLGKANNTCDVYPLC